MLICGIIYFIVIGCRLLPDKKVITEDAPEPVSYTHLLTINDTDYTLCGIIKSYTNVWQNGYRLPGVIVTDTQADVIADEITYIYAYRLRDFISETDYNTMYQSIASESGIRNNIAYNSSVYEMCIRDRWNRLCICQRVA